MKHFAEIIMLSGSQNKKHGLECNLHFIDFLFIFVDAIGSIELSFRCCFVDFHMYDCTVDKLVLRSFLSAIVINITKIIRLLQTTNDKNGLATEIM